MSMINRSYEEMVESVLNNILSAGTGITDIGKGSVVRTLVEAIVSELDIQNYQMNMIYDSIVPDGASGSDLDRVVSTFGIIRNGATKATGTVRFSTTIPAASDITIPAGTMVSTRADQNGNTIEFVTTSNAILARNMTYKDVDVSAVEPGYIYIGSGQVCIINNPIIGIESVNNISVISGGTDAETDEHLRERTAATLVGYGKGTIEAIRGAVLDVDGVIDVMVDEPLDGVPRVDVIVAASEYPMPQTISDQILAAIANTRAAGIQVVFSEAMAVLCNVTISVTNTLSGDDDIIGNAILEYFGKLRMGEDMIVSQLEKHILSKFDDITRDITTTAPAGNVTVYDNEIIRPGVITINGVVWNG